MDLDWEHYHRLNITLLSAIGLWPYGNKLVLRVKRLIAGFLAFGSCFGQLATFLTVDYTTTLVLKNAPCMFIGCGLFLKYFSFVTAGDCIKRVTEDINGDWKKLSIKEEIRIIQKYVERGRFHTKGFAIFMYPVVIVILATPLASTFLDIVMPLNKPRNQTFPIMFELWFIEQEKYFFLTTFLFEISAFFALITYVSTETVFIVYVQHACALFKLTSCRINKLLCPTGARESKRDSYAASIGLIVDIYIRALRHCKFVKDRFSFSYIILLLFGILSLGAHVFRCTQTFASHEFVEFLTSSVFCLAILSYMFYLCFVLQHLIDASLDIFDDLYDTNWYLFPPSTRKLILCCMINSVKPVPIDMYGIFIPSYEGFTLIVRMTMSYAATLHSFQ